MANVQRSNYLPYIQQHLDRQGEPDGVCLEIACGICQERKLDISQSARGYTSLDSPMTQQFGPYQHLHNYIKHGIERTVALPCGHVFGDRCIRDLQTRDIDLSCPSCGYRMTYQGCNHPIAPAGIPLDGNKPIRDTFPLTIPEGGDDPKQCLECRWKMIKASTRYTVADECVLCRQRVLANVPLDASGHRVHREQHLNFGLRRNFSDIVTQVWPEFITRETEESAIKTQAESERRQAHVSLLNTIVLSEMDDTVWYRSKAIKGSLLTKEQSRKHTRGLANLEQTLLSWLMCASREPRRMW
ncbi:uncharacterized protein F4822DRAFT_373475 [Hypoxylon trugodes]|uniref:uncharacterized protein n=1 Tax=Hypoxylon trugodes TaxID=326681 RepID=UPI002197B03E|nr:uncharacterized protein F4822DRAFT_373475 [Hypoxylon trugodes]KAI1384792.1 hypothetical protein F4822DRAFT_373475 [Hypoxylon trugodes]